MYAAQNGRSLDEKQTFYDEVIVILIVQVI